MHEEQPFNKPDLSLKKVLFHNFLGGLAWALGATVGLSLIIAIISYLIRNVDLVPIVGSFASQVVDVVINTNPHLKQ